MGNKVSCTSGNKEDREDAKAEKKAKNKPTEKKDEKVEVVAPEDVKPEVGTVEIRENGEETKEEVITTETVNTVQASKPPEDSTAEEAKTEAKDDDEKKEVEEAGDTPTASGENQEEEKKEEKQEESESKENDTEKVTEVESSVTVAPAETLEISEDIVQRVTIQTVQVSMAEILEDLAADGKDAKATTEDVPTKLEEYDSPEDRAKAKENFLLRFREGSKLHAVDFIRIWKNYDKDKSGYLDGKELRKFFHDLLESRGEKHDKKTTSDYLKILMSTFDYNKDGKLEINELAQLLPLERNFLGKFPSHDKCSKDEFANVFDHYDKDKSGFIGHTELVALLRDMFQKEGPRKMPMNDMTSYADGVFEIFDTSKDGRLARDELGMILTKKK